MGSCTNGPPPELVASLRELFKLDTFVETGTYDGDTTRWAASIFNNVVTIEASRELYDKAQPSLGQANVMSLYGSSDKALHRLVPTLPPSMFFLDAHWCGGATAGVETECPLLTELSIIMPWFRKHVILIDDARLFTQPPPPPHAIDEWPSLDDIFRVAQGAAYTAIYEDVIVMVPARHRAKVAAAIQDLAAE